MLTVPNSFSITQIRRPPGLAKSRFSRTVFPAPRKPVTRVTGIWRDHLGLSEISLERVS